VLANKSLHKIENFFPGTRQARTIRTLIESVHNKINGELRGKREHLVQATNQSIVTGFLGAIVMLSMDVGHELATGIGANTELRENRKEDIATVLLIFVAKIAIIIGHGPRSCLALFDDILDYC
jgi:hypothetical protein